MSNRVIYFALLCLSLYFFVCTVADFLHLRPFSAMFEAVLSAGVAYLALTKFKQ